MNKILASAAFAAVMAASSSVFAISIGVNATAPQGCVIPGAGATQTRTIDVNGDGTVSAGGPTTVATYAGAICNVPAKLTVKSLRGAITTGATAPVAPAPAGFANVLTYTASATWDSLAATLNANNTAGALTPVTNGPNAGAASSTLVVQVSQGGTGGNVLLSGSYADTLTVELQAN